MLTSAITAGIATVLTFLGVEPGPYIAGVWLGVKVTLVGGIGGVMWWRDRKKKLASADSQPNSK